MTPRPLGDTAQALLAAHRAGELSEDKYVRQLQDILATEVDVPPVDLVLLHLPNSLAEIHESLIHFARFSLYTSVLHATIGSYPDGVALPSADDKARAEVSHVLGMRRLIFVLHSMVDVFVSGVRNLGLPAPTARDAIQDVLERGAEQLTPAMFIGPNRSVPQSNTSLWRKSLLDAQREIVTLMARHASTGSGSKEVTNEAVTSASTRVALKFLDHLRGDLGAISSRIAAVQHLLDKPMDHVVDIQPATYPGSGEALDRSGQEVFTESEPAVASSSVPRAASASHLSTSSVGAPIGGSSEVRVPEATPETGSLARPSGGGPDPSPDRPEDTLEIDENLLREVVREEPDAADLAGPLRRFLLGDVSALHGAPVKRAENGLVEMQDLSHDAQIARLAIRYHERRHGLQRG